MLPFQKSYMKIKVGEKSRKISQISTFESEGQLTGKILQMKKKRYRVVLVYSTLARGKDV